VHTDAAAAGGRKPGCRARSAARERQRWIRAGCPLELSSAKTKQLQTHRSRSGDQPTSGQVGRSSSCGDSRLRPASSGDPRPIRVRDLCGMQEEPAVERREKKPICRYFSGSDGTRTRDLRRDRPLQNVATCTTMRASSPCSCGSWVASGSTPHGRAKPVDTFAAYLLPGATPLTIASLIRISKLSAPVEGCRAHFPTTGRRVPGDHAAAANPRLYVHLVERSRARRRDDMRLSPRAVLGCSQAQ
jgi:hypothetical protein